MAEYILSNGNMQVMLCERGIRTYETATRNTFDLNAIPVLKRASHLPVVADPRTARATGNWCRRCLWLRSRRGPMPSFWRSTRTPRQP